MKTKKPWGQAKQLVIMGHAEGLTVRQTAETYGLTTTTVRCLAARLGISMKMQPRGQWNKQTRKYERLPTFPNSFERGK